jgi:predicted nucleic acid-binding protein
VEPLILDASVLIGLLDTQDSHHDRAVDEIDRADRADHQLLAPASAYSEALIAFARAGRVKDARDAVAGMGITVVPLTASIAERAADLRAEHDALRLPDALVLATAHAHDGSLITYDHRLAQTARQHPKA